MLGAAIECMPAEWAETMMTRVKNAEEWEFKGDPQGRALVPLRVGLMNEATAYCTATPGLMPSKFAPTRPAANPGAVRPKLGRKGGVGRADRRGERLELAVP